jgi:chlorobactene glucosyltransferase
MHVEWAGTVGICFVLAVLSKLLWKSLTFPRFLQARLLAASDFSQADPNDRPLQSVIIPAKDEGHRIWESVERILASEECRLELILVNDRSQDNTLAVMEELAREDSRIKVVSVNELPEGWTGKTHAMFKGVEIATGEILLFIDADCSLHPHALYTALNWSLSKDIDLFSLVPGFTARGFIEDAIFPVLAMGLLHYFPLREVNDPAKPIAFASGAFFMMTRKAYERIGGWNTVRSEVTEDIAMAKLVKGQGMKVMVLRGSNLVRVEPFDNVSQVFRFWKRVYYGGLERNVSKILRLVVNHVALTLVYAFFLLSGYFCLTHVTPTAGGLFVLTTATVALTMILHVAYVRQEGGNWIYGLGAIAGFLAGVYVALSVLGAIICHTGIRWHGSSYR